MQLISFRNGQPIELPVPEELDSAPTDAVVAGGGSVSLRAWPVIGDEQLQQAMTRLGALARVSGLALRRPLAAAYSGGRLVVAEEASDGVTLSTLRRLVPLTFDQAAVVAEGLLAAVAALEQAAVAHGDPSWTQTVLGTDGRVRFTGADPFAAAGRGDRGAVAAMAATLLTQASASSLKGVPEAVQERLLSLVSELELRDRSAASVLGSWRHALGAQLDPSAKRRVRGQLQALGARLLELDRGSAPSKGAAARPGLTPSEPARQVLAEATVGIQRPILAPRRQGAPGERPQDRHPEAPRPWIRPAARPAEAGPRPVAPQLDAPRPASEAEPAAPGPAVPLSPPHGRPDSSPPPSLNRGPRPRWVALGAVAVVLLLLVGGGSALLLHRGAPSTTSARSHQGPSGTHSPSTGRASPSPGATQPSPPAQTPALREIPLLGPTSNPPIQSVQVTSGCPSTGSGSCTFTVTAQLGSHPADTVSWQLDMVNRCTGGVTEVASGDIPAAADYTYVEAQPDVTVPASIPVGMVALAGAPGEAASAPLLITPQGASCPG